MEALTNIVISDLAPGISTKTINTAIGSIFNNARNLDSALTEDVVDIKTRVNNFNRLIDSGSMKYGEQVLEGNQIALSIIDLIRRSSSDEDELNLLSSNSQFKGIIKILFVTSNPDDTAKLRLTKEIKQIENELSKAKYRDFFTIHKKELATVNDLSDGLLNYSPDFVHFTGHGTKKGILLHNSNDEKVVIPNDSLANLFELFSKKLACVFMNSCYSDEQAKIINKYIPNVIGMNNEVAEQTAMTFATSFYKSIGAGKGLDFSFEFAKVTLGLNNLMGDSIPILMTKTNRYAS